MSDGKPILGPRWVLWLVVGLVGDAVLPGCLAEPEEQEVGVATGTGQAGFAEETCGAWWCEEECQDGLWCNGPERCDCWGLCVPPDPTFNICFDNDPCTSDFCDEVHDVCPHTFVPGPGCGTCRTDADCGDDDACTTDRCDPATGKCLHPVRSCDDGRRCTDDRCDPASGICVHVWLPACPSPRPRP